MNPQTAAQIAQATAARRRAALAGLQDAKRTAYQRAEELYSARREHRQAAALNEQERELTAGHPLDLFPTPPALAARMVQLARLPKPEDIAHRHTDGIGILEPSAGTGRIAQAIRDAGHECLCIELNQSAADLLKARGFGVECADFMEWIHPGNCYEAVIMNPPFSNGQDIEHVRRAFDFLDNGGRLVAIMSEGTFFRSDKKAQEFRDWLKDREYSTSEKLPPDTFKTSGTGVNARLVIVDK